MTEYQRRKYNEMIEKMQRYIKEYEFKIEMWEKVKRVSKKNGGDFTVFSKNFENASIEPALSVLRPDYEIVVYGRLNGNSIKDYINICPCVKNYKKAVDPARVKSETLIEPYFNMTIEEVFEAIQEQIEKYRVYICDLKRQIDISEKVYTEFTNAIDNAMKELKEAAGKDTTLYYSAREYMEKAH